jgi:hypothetical protein
MKVDSDCIKFTGDTDSPAAPILSPVPTIRAKRGNAFSEEERRAILDRFRAAWSVVDAGDADRATIDAARAEMAAAAAEYVAGVPIVSLSRCPITGQVFETSLDIHGIDGIWWGYDYDYRPYVEPIPTFFAWTGAMQLDGPIPEWSLKAMVGPAAPFVLPRLLDHPHLRAVVSSVLVGEHIGFPIVYYASPIPHDLERVDDWGHRFYYFTRADGTPGSDHSVQDDDEKDFDLGPWLDRGKLSWIAPGDLSLTLRQGRDECPYLNLPGERRRRYIQEGDTWLA